MGEDLGEGVIYFHLHLVLLGSMRVYPENTGNSEK
jgi:hypothetical protein